MRVEKSDTTEGRWDYTCDACGFVSLGWDTRRLATARGREHAAEHETREAMRELADFVADPFTGADANTDEDTD